MSQPFISTAPAPSPSPSPSPRYVLPQPNANVIWRAAWLSFLSSIYALTHPDTVYIAIVPAAVLTTSLNYWRDPVRDSWRRTIDIYVVYSGIGVICSYAYYYLDNTKTVIHKHAFFYLIFTSFMCYIVSEYYLKRNQLWPATYAHACIHIFANIANIVLCEGVVAANTVSPE